MITPIVVSSLIYSTNRRTVLELISPRLRTLWKEWDLRLAVLISLFFHILLSILGNRRKYSRNLWIRISVWSAYTAADSVIVFALGIISTNLSVSVLGRCSGGHLEPNIEMATVWAQFLLLYMGGPDSITAYALEDNELWLRQLLGLVSQAFAAIYLILLSWTDEEGSRLSILSIMMFIVGFIKYGERTWVLRAASYQIHRKSVQDENADHNNRRGRNDGEANAKPEYDIKRKEGYVVKKGKCPCDDVLVSIPGFTKVSISDEKKFRIVNQFSSVTRHLFVDAALNSSFRNTVQTVFRNLSLEDAFQLIEIQIGMIYDLRYTKAPLLHSRKGLCLRLVTFFLTCCSLVLFSAFIDHKAKNYSKIDLSITFLLLAVAVLLEINAALVFIFSDIFAIWLINQNKTSTFRILNSFRLVKSPRWSNTMSQYTLIRRIRKTRRLLPLGRFLKIGIRLARECHEWNTQVTNDVKEMIFPYFKEKSEELEDGKNPFTALPTTTSTNQEEEQGTSIWEQYEYKIIIWSIATEILYYIDREHIPPCSLPKLKAIKRISRYMLYLLVKNPSMISAETGLMVVTLEGLTTIIHSKFKEDERYLRDSLTSAETGSMVATRKANECNVLLRKFCYTDHNENDQNRCLMGKAMKLVKELQNTAQKERWERIGNNWMEMLGYAARKSKSNNHTQQLRHGGEFITHVWHLMASFGLTDHFQIPSPSITHGKFIAK